MFIKLAIMLKVDEWMRRGDYSLMWKKLNFFLHWANNRKLSLWKIIRNKILLKYRKDSIKPRGHVRNDLAGKGLFEVGLINSAGPGIC